MAVLWILWYLYELCRAGILYFLTSITNRRRREQEPVEKYYEVGSLLGKGGCGSVYAGVRISDGLPVALKYVQKHEADEILLPEENVRVPTEVGLMRLVNKHAVHPNVLRLHEWFDAPDHFVMVLERPDPCVDLLCFCESQKGRLDEELAKVVIGQLLLALQHCRRCGVFHSDVKPANLLINTETLRVILIDFGCGALWERGSYNTFAGTDAFAPPEVFVKGLYKAGPATVWSIGVTLFNMVCGCLPFEHFNKPGKTLRYFPKGLSPEIKDFISWCMAPRAKHRATLEDLQVHPWLCSILPEPEYVEAHYTIGSKLGVGGCGTVYSGMRIADGVRVALKYVAKREGDELLIPGQEVATPREVGLMRQVNLDGGHPNVLRFYDWFEEPDQYVMAMELPEHSMNLTEFCASQNGSLDERQARPIIAQLLLALRHCQQSGVFHRDVKPDNVLIVTETLRVVLIDFGCGALWQETPYTIFEGTYEFAPPEVFTAGGYQAGPCTVWSLGVTLYNLVSGHLPFTCDGERRMSMLSFPEGLSSEIMDFFRCCWAAKVEDRATLDELQVHPWLRPISPAQVGPLQWRESPEDRGEKAVHRVSPDLSSSLSPPVRKRKREWEKEERNTRRKVLDLSSSLSPPIRKRKREWEKEERNTRRKVLDLSRSPSPPIRKRKREWEKEERNTRRKVLDLSSSPSPPVGKRKREWEKEERNTRRKVLDLSRSPSPPVGKRKREWEKEERNLRQKILDLSSSPIPAAIKRKKERENDGEEESSHSKSKKLKAPVNCCRTAPGMTKRKMAPEDQAGDLACCCRDGPAKRFQKGEAHSNLVV